MGLAPLKPFGITRVMATTMQAISGAGYPGVASRWTSCANVIPFIGGEEEKMQQETQKILGDFRGDHVEPLAARSERALQPRAGGGRAHRDGLGGARRQALRAGADLRAFDGFTGVPQERQLPSAPGAAGDLHGRARPPAAARGRGARARHGGVCGPPAAVPGAGLQVRRAGTQHRARRGRRGRAERRADALGRDCWTSMIVMKFGGTSVESAAAIERVAGIVKARLERQPVVVVSAMGKTTNKLLAIASDAVAGKRERGARAAAGAARLSPGARRGRLSPRRAAPGARGPCFDEHFQELGRSGQGPGGAGRADAALDRRHLELRRAAVEPHRGAGASRRFGMDAAHVDSRRVIVTDRRHTQAAPALPGDLRAAGRDRAPLARGGKWW